MRLDKSLTPTPKDARSLHSQHATVVGYLHVRPKEKESVRAEKN